jgi:hypothetical protein
MDTIIQIPNFINENKKVFNNLLNNIKWNKINYFKRHICHYNYDNENYEVNQIIKNGSGTILILSPLSTFSRTDTCIP